MNRLIVLSNITQKNNLTGPGKVAFNLYNAIRDKGYDITFVNTNTKNKMNCFNLVKFFIKILFLNNYIINIHSFGYIIPYIVLIISKINKKNSYYLTLHGILSVENEIYNRKTSKFKLHIENELITQFPKIIVVSHFEKKTIVEKFDRSENIYVIYNGIENEMVSLPKYMKDGIGKITLVTAGGVSNLKGIFTLLNLINKFNKEENYELFLHIYGNYENEEIFCEFNEFITGKHLQNNIFYHGLVSNEQIIREFRKADFCVALSKYDTFNMTILEAMACGTPAIVTKSVGISEIIDARYGLVLDSPDNIYEEFKEYIYLITDSQIYYNLSENSINLTKKYTWDIISDEYIRLFNIKQ